MKIYQAGFCCVKLLYLGITSTQFSSHRILLTLSATFPGNADQAGHSYIQTNMCTHRHYYFPIHKLLGLISAFEMALFIIVIVIIIIIIIIINIV